MAYTWAQFTAYLKLARQERARRRIEQVVDSSNAFAGGPGVRQLMQTLADQAKG
jgi:hypothetical protein